MRFLSSTLLLLPAVLTICLAKPIPLANLDEIERRWSQGESESSIHAAHSYRDATPAWPVVRDSLDELSWDERSAAVRNRKRNAQVDVAKLKAFVAKFYRQKGMDERAKQVNDVPVLKPKRGMKYPFAS